MFDAKRDAETKAALQPAEKASAMLVEGFKKIPNALRLRYPQEMSNVGNVPVAKLQVGSFGKDVLMGAAFGQLGQDMNDLNMARKIKQNEESLARCIAVVNEQRQLMQIVQAKLDQDILNIQRSAPAVRAAPVPPPAVMPGLPPAIAPQQNMVELTSPHTVDEFNPAIQQHQIISVPVGARVRLVRGTLADGLGAPYNDYIEVDYNGRVGKISRLIVRPIAGGGGGIPPAIGAAQQPYF